MVKDFSNYPVSILKPLKGAEEGLAENLRSFFQLDYPQYELIFSVADPADPARLIVEKLLSEYPRVSARLIVGDEKIGPNPKVNNMLTSYQQSLYELVLISDSNIRVRPNYLKRMIPFAAEPGVGLVTALISGIRAREFGGFLEATFLNTFCARGMASAFVAGKPCVVGKSMLFYKSAADRFGGLRVLGRFLAEDYMAGEAMTKLGLKVVLMSDPVEQYLGKYTFTQFWLRHVRWGRIRKAQAPLIFPFELMQNAVFMGLLGALAASSIWGIPYLRFLEIHLGIWMLCDLLLLRAMNRDYALWRAPIDWIIREICAILIYVQVAANNSVNWRGQTLRLGLGGVIE